MICAPLVRFMDLSLYGDLLSATYITLLALSTAQAFAPFGKVVIRVEVPVAMSKENVG